MRIQKILIILFWSITLIIYSKETIVLPKSPKEPNNPTLDNKSEITKNETKINIEYKKQNGKTNNGIVYNMKGFYLKLQWEGNENKEQEILIDFVKSIKIKGYTMTNKTKDKLTVVYYFPYLYDITLKDGTEIKNAKGRIKEIDSFIVYNNMGKEKCYTYFIRYWLEDKKIFTDTKSSNYYENPTLPKNVVIYLKFN